MGEARRRRIDQEREKAKRLLTEWERACGHCGDLPEYYALPRLKCERCGGDGCSTCVEGGNHLKCKD
jgi:hypothetical protein